MAKVASVIGGVPDALTAREQWVCWRREERDGRTTKAPVEPSTGSYASTPEPDTWEDFETALEAVEAADTDGVGFVFTDDDPIVGVDLDDCRDPINGTIDERAREVITRLDSYAEVSPSETGVHVIAEVELPAGRSRSGDVEMYETSRFFTVTGEHLDQTQTGVHRRVDAIRGVHADNVQDRADDSVDTETETPPESGGQTVDLDDDKILDRARDAANGDRFDALWRGQTAGYDSHSEADMALYLHLAFWTGGDRARMEALFRQSGLMRAKWDEVHYADGATYGERTIERAVERVDEVYELDADPEGNEPDGSATESATETDGDAGDAERSLRRADELVYLEERNRLLREKVRSQQATMEEPTDRIDHLEEELDAARTEPVVRALSDDRRTERPSLWNRLSSWFIGA